MAAPAATVAAWLLLMMMMARRRTMRGCQFRPGHKNGQTIRAGGTCCCLQVAPCCCPLLLPVASCPLLLPVAAAAAASQCNGTISTRECAFILKCCVCNGLSRGLGLQLIQKSKQARHQARHHRRGSNAEIREATATVRQQQQQQQQACCMQQAAKQLAAGNWQLGS